MKYRLGLDLGVGSIGSAVVELDSENNAKEIRDAGVRIFEVSEGAEDRRLKRTARKNLVRTKKRLELLAKNLFANGLWPNENPEGTDTLKSKSPYKIRRDALDGKLSNANYVGRAILHIAKHRGAGFVSASAEMEEEVLDEGEKSKKKASSYDLMTKYLKDSGSRTLGEFFYKRLCDKEAPRVVRQKKYALEKKIVDYAIPRWLAKDEFHKIWDKQAGYFPQMQKEGLKREIYDILFYERPHAPYAIGKCIYIADEDRLSKAHPLSEMRRIYEEVNNIRIETDTDRRPLTLEERDKIVGQLLEGGNAGKQLIKKLLDTKYKISLMDDKVIKAHFYAKPEFSGFGADKLEELAEFLANPVNPEDKSGRLFNDDELVKLAMEKLNIGDEKKIGELLSKLPKGRGMLGKTATQMLLEKMKEKVISHREASDEIAKTDKRFQAEEEIARQMQGKYNGLPYYGEILRNDTQGLPPLMKKNNEKTLNADEMKWGKIANPAVHMILNQLRKVVNEIIKIYGKPCEINIELGRDVGLSTKKKEEKEKQQKANEKLNDEAKKYLADHQMPITGKNILKYKLAKEQGWKDAYNPQSNISQRFDGMEIEHIIPQAKGGSDTYSNLCLVSEKDNKAKGDRFSYDYLAEVKSPEELREILKTARERLKGKAWRFEADAREKFEDEGDKDETNRYLTDTRYVAKMAGRYLRAIVDCADSEIAENRILAVRGAQTAELRKRWYLDGLEYDLMGLDIPRYLQCEPYWVEQETGVVEKGKNKPDIDGNWRFFDKAKNPEWSKKPRIDHRHHAMDAIAVACATRSLVQKMAHETDMRKVEISLPLASVDSAADFRRKTIEVLKEIKVSHKPDTDKNGQFHKEKVRTPIGEAKAGKVVTRYKREVMDVLKKFEHLDKLLVKTRIKGDEKVEEDRKKQQELKGYFEQYKVEAQKLLEEENREEVSSGKKEKKITEAVILAKTFKLIKDKKLWIGDSFNHYEMASVSSLVAIPKHKVSYESGNNYCMDFYEKNGEIGWECISRFNANHKGFVPKWKTEGGKPLWSLHINDMVEIKTPAEWNAYTGAKEKCLAKVRKMQTGEICLEYASDSRDDKTVDKRTFSIKPFCELVPRKIELTPFGKIKKKHKKLWNGKKAEA